MEQGHVRVEAEGLLALGFGVQQVQPNSFRTFSFSRSASPLNSSNIRSSAMKPITAGMSIRWPKRAALPPANCAAPSARARSDKLRKDTEGDAPYANRSTSSPQKVANGPNSTLP